MHGPEADLQGESQARMRRQGTTGPPRPSQICIAPPSCPVAMIQLTVSRTVGGAAARALAGVVGSSEGRCTCTLRPPSHMGMTVMALMLPAAQQEAPVKADPF